MGIVMNDHSPSTGSFHGGPGHKPVVAEETIHTEKIQVERKLFLISLKKNPRGRFLRVTEDVGKRRSTIIIPSSGLDDFRKVVEEMARLSAATPETAN